MVKSAPLAKILPTRNSLSLSSELKISALGFPKKKKNWPGLCFTRYVSEWFRATYRSSCRQSPRNHRKFRGSIFLTTQSCWLRNTQKPAARASKDSHMTTDVFFGGQDSSSGGTPVRNRKKNRIPCGEYQFGWWWRDSKSSRPISSSDHLEDPLLKASPASPTHQPLILHKGRGFHIFVFENGWGSCKTPHEPRCFTLKMHGETKFASCSVQDSV